MAHGFTLQGFRAVVLASVVALGCPGASTNSAEIYASDAERALEEGEVTEAQALAELAAEAEPRDPDTRKLVARVMRAHADEAESNGAFRTAYQGYLDAAEYEPYRRQRADDLMAAVSLGKDLGVGTDELLELIVRAVEAYPADTEIRRTAASIADTAGEVEIAIENYLWVWEADRSDSALGLRLGALYLQADRPDDAMAIYERVLENDPDNVQAHILRAEALEDAGKANRARAVYVRLVEKFPDNPGLFYRYASFLERQGDSRRANEIRARAKELLPGVERRDMRRLR